MKFRLDDVNRVNLYSSKRGRKLNDNMLHKSMYKRSTEALRIPAAGTVILAVMLVVLAVAGVLRLFGAIQVTDAAPDRVISSEAEINAGEQMGGETEEDTPAENAAVTLLPPMPAPAEGSPEYMFKYPEMYVERAWYKEIDPEQKLLYLTFDDGPCANTDDILDKLDQLGVKATFFVTGMYDSKEALVAKMTEIDSRGHKLAVHTFCHDYNKIYSSVDAYLDDYKLVDDMIVEATGKRSGIYRFPGGSNTGYNEQIRNDLLIEMMRRGFVFHDWNASNGDSDGLSPQGEIDKAIGECKSQNRSVLLMHDAPGKAQVADSLDPIVSSLLADGYQFELLDETVEPVQFTHLEPVG